MTEEERSVVERFRESHHAVARMFAAGMTPSMIRQKTGYSIRRLTILAADPSFQMLIVHYARSAIEKWNEAEDAYTDLAIGNMLAAERQLSDKIAAADEAGEFLPTRELLMITSDRGDRFGYSKHTVHEHKHDFAAALDRAIKRSEKVIQIEGNATELRAQPAESFATSQQDRRERMLLPEVSSPTIKESLVEIAPKHHPPLAPLAPRQNREPPKLTPVSGPLIRRKVA